VLRRLDAAHSRHVEIHHDDVRRKVGDLRHSLRPGSGLADDLDPLLLEEVPQPCAKEILVVDEQDTKRLRRPRPLFRVDVRRHPRTPLPRGEV
jgi:hypothetical protein